MQQVNRLLRPHQETRRQEVLLNLAIIVGVTALILTLGIVIAIGVGMAVATLMFLRHSGQAVVRRQFHGHRVHSRVRRAPDSAALLEEHGRAIQVFEVQGPIFFGTSDELVRQVEDQSDEARTVILDFKRVTEIDSTGAIILGRLEQGLRAKSKQLLWTYLVPGQENFRELKEMSSTVLELEQ